MATQKQSSKNQLIGGVINQNRSLQFVQTNRVKTVIQQIIIMGMAIYVLWSDSIAQYAIRNIFQIMIEHKIMIHQHITPQNIRDGVFLGIFLCLFAKGLLRKIIKFIYIGIIGCDLFYRQDLYWQGYALIVVCLGEHFLNKQIKSSKNLQNNNKKFVVSKQKHL